jgi:rhamnose transport system permease protein
VAVLMAIGVGLALGAINGVIIAYGKVPAIITTLGTLAIYRTMLVEYANSKSVITSSLPEWLVNLPQQNAFMIGEIEFQQVVVIALLIVVAFQVVITYLPWGRRIYAIGSNPEAAEMAGLPVSTMVFSTYMISGALCGLAGFIFLARFGTVTVVAAQGMELQVVAAVVVGGVNIFGGSGSMVGAFLGTLLIATLEQSLLRWAAVSEFWRDAVLGMLILLSVAADAFLLAGLRRLWSTTDYDTHHNEPPPVAALDTESS